VYSLRYHNQAEIATPCYRRASRSRGALSVRALVLIFAALALCAPGMSFAATYYYVGPTGANDDWNRTQNWSFSSGGRNRAGIPVAGDTVYFDANSGNCTLDANAACATLDTTGYTNTLALGTYDLVVSGSVTHAGGTMTIGASSSVGLQVGGAITNSATITCSGASRISCGGNWANTGTFNASSSTVTFVGAAASTISGTTTFNNLYCTTAGKQINFTDGTTQTVSGDLYLEGASGSDIVLRATVGAVRWNLDVTNGSEYVYYVDVQDSNALTNTITVGGGAITDCNSNWIMGSEPTRAVVSRLDAYAEDGRVVVRWETASEDGTLGFRLLRRDGRKGRYESVSERMLPALLNAPQGGVYRLADPGAHVGLTYSYKLVEIETRGTTRSHGPFRVTVGEKNGEEDEPKLAGESSRRARATARPAPVQAGGKSGGRAPSSGRAPKPTRRPPRPKPPRLTALKLSVKKSGLYYVATADAASLWGIPTNLVSRKLRRGGLCLKCRGRKVPYLVAEDYGGLYFYGQAIDSIYTDENVYWLEIGRGSQMHELSGGAGAPAAETLTFTDTVHAEQNHYPGTGLYDDPEADFWLWDYIVAGAPGLDTKSFTIIADGAEAEGTATVAVHLKGASDTTADPDHHAVVKVNGVTVNEQLWDGLDSCTVEATFDSALLVDGLNTVTVVGLPDTEAPQSVFYINSIDLSYRRRYEAVGDALLCRAEDNEVVTISGFTDPDIWLFDVTSAGTPMLVEGASIDEQDGDFRLTVTPDAPGCTYFAVAPAGVKTPAGMKADVPSSLLFSGRGSECVIIAPATLMSAAQSLAAHRTGEGLSVAVADLEDVYDEFNYGIVDPHAVKAFLGKAGQRWRRLRYVVLAGNGTYDYKDYVGAGDNLLPALMIDTDYGLFAADGEFAPGLAVGRLPATSNAQLQAMVDKIIAYEGAGGAWTSRVLIAADDPDAGGNFPQDSDTLAALVPAAYTVEKTYLSDYSLADARTRLINGINAGAVWLNYMGHGGPDRFASEGLLTSADAAAMNGAPCLPVVTGLTCLSGRFACPGLDSLGEALVLNPNGGAIAVFAPTGYSFHYDAEPFGREFLQSALQWERKRLGDAVREAMDELGGYYRMPESLKVYNLLGDPALRMKHAE